MSRALGSASPKLRSAAPAVAFASVYFLTAALTDSLVGDAGSAVLWPASGLYLGVMLIAPHRMWRALVVAAGVGSLAAYLYGGSSLQVSVAFAVPSAAEGFLAALLVERIAQRRFRLEGLHDLFALVVGAALVANALIACSAGAVAAQTFDASFAESWLRWWSADALGMLAVAPILTAPLRPGLRRPARWWSGPRVAALAGLAAALVALQLVAHSSVDVYAAQAFLAVLLLASLGFTASARERERMRQELGRTREGSAEQLDRARRRIDELTAELAASRAEAIQGGRGQERLAEQLRESDRARERAERGRERAEQERERAERELERTQRELERTQRELADARGAVAAMRKELDTLGRDIGLTVADRDRVRSELHDSARARERLEAELAAAAADLADARAAAQALEDALESVGVESRALAAELESARADNAALTDELRGEQEQSGAAHNELHQVRGDHARVAEELDRARVEQVRMAEELEGARVEHVRMAEELEGARVEQVRMAEELEGARAENARVAEELEDAASQTRRAQEDLAVVAGRVEGLEGELELAQGAYQDAELALDHARARFSERREQLERSLAEGTEKLARLEAQLADRASELTSRYDERGTCLSVSAAFAGLLGYDPHELVGRPGTELLHPADRPRLARARATRGQTSFEARLLRKTGEFVWVEVSLDPIWSGGGERLVELQTTVRRLSLAA
jgi:PAS domain S-box-containing protein